jgi:adenine-specific DNA-methyltransferase
MQNLYNDLRELLLQNEQYVIDGKLNKPKIEDDGLNLETNLIKTLLQNIKLKKHFFKDIDGVMVFDKVKFQRFINNKQFLPDSYTEFKNKIGLTVDSKFLTEFKEVVLDFPYKDCVLQGCQDREDAKRDEVFFNETLAPDDIDMLLEPKVLTGFKKYDANGCHIVTDVTIEDNFIIKGNNLLALHSLKQIYRGKVKLIYIDPPYNTGNDGFKYNDKFNHSTWLTFMKNRLEIARELLREDGVIFVQIDDNEQAYLKVLMDETFGRNNFVNTICVQSSTPSGVKISHSDKTILKSKDYILVYKNVNILFKPQYIKKASWDIHYIFFIENENNKYILKKLTDKLVELGIFNNKHKINDFDINNKIHKNFYIEYGDFIVRKSTHENKKIKDICENKFKDEIYCENGFFYLNHNMLQPISRSFHNVMSNISNEYDMSNLLCDLWIDIDFQNTQNEGGISLTSGKKPEFLLQRIIDMVTKPGDIILDYHLGSGTTAAVAHKMGRRYIGVEQMDYIDELVITRLKNVIGINKNNDAQLIVDESYQDYDVSGISRAVNWQGGGGFIYCELMQNNQIWVDKINDINDSKQLIQLWQIMQDKAQLSYKVDISQINTNINKFEQLSLEEQKRFLIEVLDKNQLYINYTEIDDIDYSVSDADKQLNDKFYSMK